ncbi:hypothetical protein [Hyphomonas johnsonii]|uniref:Lipoprotein n=1 Tax=Hyphomonas johnsonii MHS-2 TaxID=1280950 RepID=A0A059FU82_9PROT|nr:hypothetical protein [Hyphomonas johnsonii]KCZ94162.1 hypothetical protein HJO_02265 [Hyphomonas johnsonii MHS-2]
MKYRGIRVYSVIVAALFGLTACESIQPARMVAPPALAGQTVETPIEGIGGGTRGTFRFGDHSGTFSRSESRLAFFNILENRSGYTNFTLRGPNISDQIEVKCTMRERNITISVVSFTPKKMAYGCDFTANGYPFPARFELQEVREGLGGALSKKERRGEIALDRVILTIRSVHSVEGSPIQVASPIGYVFELDGRPVGAVEVNGTPRAMLPVSGDPALKRAVIAASLALGLFWDPANSQLGELD